MSVLTKQGAVIRCCLFAALSGCSAAAFATSKSMDRPIYGFVQVGTYEQDLRDDYLASFGADSGFSAQSISIDVDKRETTWAAGLGYQLLPWLAAELSYSDFDPLTLQATSVLPNARVRSVVETQAVAIDAVAKWEFAPSWHASARLGAARWDAELTSAVTEPSELANNAQLDDNDVSIKFGLALAYQFTEQLAASLHLDQFQVDSEKLGIDTPVRTLSGRLTWRF